MKKTITQDNPRAISNGQFTFGPEQAQVVANPVSVVAAPKTNGASAFLQGLKAFEQGAGNFLQAKHTEFTQEEAAKGAMAELQNPSAEEPVYTTDHTPWYQESRVDLWGKRKAMELQGGMEAAFEKLKQDPNFADTDIKAWTAKYIQENTAGLKDPTAAAPILGALTERQMKIVGEAGALQEAARAQKMAQDFSVFADGALKESNYSTESVQALVADAKARGIPPSVIATSLMGAVRYGMSKGVWDASKVLDTPVQALNGLTLRMVAKPEDQDNIDTMLGKGFKEGREKALETFGENAAFFFQESGVSMGSINALVAKAASEGLTRAETATHILSALEGRFAAATTPEEQAQVTALLDAKIPALGGRTLRTASSLKDRGGVDAMTSKVVSAQKAAMEETRQNQADIERAQFEQNLIENPEAIPEDDKQLAQMTLFNPAYKGTQTGVQLYLDAVRKRQEGRGNLAFAELYRNGQWTTAFGATEGDARKAALFVEKQDMESGLSKDQIYPTWIARGAANKMPSPTLQKALQGVRLEPATIKNEQGEEVPNPRMGEMMVVLNAIRKSGNPGVLSQYAQGEDLVFLNAVDVLVNDRGLSLEDALKTAKMYSAPERKAEVDAMTREHKQTIMDYVNSGLSRAEGVSFFGINLHNRAGISSAVERQIPYWLAATGGDVSAAKTMAMRDVTQRVVAVRTQEDSLSLDEGFGVVVPPAFAAEDKKLMATALQQKYDALKKQYAGQGPVTFVPSITGKDDTTFQVMVGMSPKGTFSFSELMTANRTQAAQAAQNASATYLQSRGIDSNTIAMTQGKMSRPAYQQLTEKETQQSLAQFQGLMQQQETVEKDLQGNPQAPVMKGRGPTSNYGLAMQYADSDPEFAIGVSCEGISEKAYRDNDGGITIGLGYNTKHQTPAVLMADFQKAGLPTTPAYIEGLKNGTYRLTVPQQQELHRVAFARYQAGAKKVFEELYPGTYDTLTRHQKAAVGQLAYNTGWHSGVLKKFLTKVGQGREEDAIRELRVTWRDKKGGVHVNYDLMRKVRAMWAGPEAFKKALSLGKAKG